MKIFDVEGGEKKTSFSRLVQVDLLPLSISKSPFFLLPPPPRAGPVSSAPALPFSLGSVASSFTLQKMSAAMLRARCAPVSTARASTSSTSSTSRVAAAAAVPLRRSPIVARAAAADVELSPGSPPADLIIVTGDASSAPSGAKVLEKKRSRRFKELKAKVRFCCRNVGEERKKAEEDGGRDPLAPNAALGDRRAPNPVVSKARIGGF